MANRMPFANATVWGAAGSAWGSTQQITLAASSSVYLATSSNSDLRAILPSWCVLTLSATGSQNVSFQVNPDAVGTTWNTWANLASSMTLFYLDGTAGQRVLNNNAVPVAVYITPLKF